MNAGVAGWFAGVPDDSIHLSVVTIGEIRRGIQGLRTRDARQAAALDRWIGAIVREQPERILPIDLKVAEEWGSLMGLRNGSVIDALLAATAIVGGLVLVTRNVRDVSWTGVEVLNPFRG